MAKSKSTYVFNDITLLIVIIVVLVISIFMLSYYITGNSLMENFTGNMIGNKSIEYYYMNGCSHCETFNKSGIWKELEEKYGANIKFNKYENKQHSDRVKKYDITGFPTIIIISNEKVVEEYNGNRSKEDLEKFIRRNI
jgi:thioredoxin-like negative regulator of GroEL